MNQKSKAVPLLILAAAALACSRTMLALIDDPEGPNLLVVAGMAAILYVLSLSLYSFLPSAKPALLASLAKAKNLLSVLVLQILLTIGFFLYLS